MAPLSDTERSWNLLPLEFPRGIFLQKTSKKFNNIDQIDLFSHSGKELGHSQERQVFNFFESRVFIHHIKQTQTRQENYRCLRKNQWASRRLEIPKWIKYSWHRSWEFGKPGFFNTSRLLLQIPWHLFLRDYCIDARLLWCVSWIGRRTVAPGVSPMNRIIPKPTEFPQRGRYLLLLTEFSPIVLSKGYYFS